MEGTSGDFKEHYHYGKVYLESGEAENALSQFRVALETEPDNPNILIGAGRSLMLLERYEEAVEYLEKAVKRSPEFADVHFHLGMVYRETGDKQRAINEFKEALNINPKYLMAKAMLNELFAMADEPEPKKKVHEVESRADEEKRISRQANVHFHMGNALFQKNMLKEAHAEYKQAINLRPNYPDIRNKLGELYVERRRYDLADREFEAALKINPRYMQAQLNLAESRRLHSEMLLVHAEEDYKKALDMDPESQKARQGLEKVKAMRNIDYL